MPRDDHLASWMKKLMERVAGTDLPEDVRHAIEVVCEYATTLIRMERILPGSKCGRKKLVGLSLTTRSSDPTQTLAVLRSVEKDKRYVTFCSGPTGVDALRRLTRKILEGDVRWQEDRPMGASEDEPEDNGLPELPSL